MLMVAGDFLGWNQRKRKNIGRPWRRISKYFEAGIRNEAQIVPRSLASDDASTSLSQRLSAGSVETVGAASSEIGCAPPPRLWD